MTIRSTTMMASDIDANTLAKLVQNVDPFKKTLIVDCRSFIDYNVLHVRNAINAFYSKMMRRRVYDSKVCNSVMLSQIGEEKCNSSALIDLVLYSEGQLIDQSTNNNCSPLLSKMRQKCCAATTNNLNDSPQKLLRTLQEKFSSSKHFHNVFVLRDGFDDFRNRFPELCESSPEQRDNMEKKGVVEGHIRTSLSHPCLSSSTDGPTQLLPFLYLGSQQDAMNSGVLSRCGIKYVINLSVNCPLPDSLKQEGHFMRIPVNDTYQEKLLPHFEDAFKFLDEVCERGSVALVHCLAGISRSPTLAIAYMMRRNKWTSEQAYRYVKERRPSISPNFNFMGQLLEYETRLREQDGLSATSGSSDNPLPSSTSFATSTLSSFDLPSGVQQVKRDDGMKTVELGNSVSCEAVSHRVSFRPQNFWENDCKEPSSKTNENGKRVMETANSHLLDRPRILDGLKSRKALSVPSKVDEDLPSPSTELQKLSFGHPPDKSNSVSNPFFSDNITTSTNSFVIERSSLPPDPLLPSTSTEKGHYWAENQTFLGPDALHPSAALPPSRESYRAKTSHKLLTRLNHCIRRGITAYPVQQSDRKSSVTVVGLSSSTKASTLAALHCYSPFSCTGELQNSTLSNGTTTSVFRSHSVSALDKTQKHGSSIPFTASFRASFIYNQRIRKKQSGGQSHFITTVADTTANNNNDNSRAAVATASGTSTTSEVSTSFPETDRDSISSASSLEILVQ